LLLSGAVLYFSDSFGDLKACPTPDCAGGPRIVVSNAFGPEPWKSGGLLGSNGQYLYAGNAGGGIYECLAAKCSETLTLVAHGYGSPSGAVSSNALYFSGGSALFSCSIPGCAGGPLPLAWASSASALTYPVAVDSTHVYAIMNGQPISIP
jgi:hypothetical protein